MLVWGDVVVVSACWGEVLGRVGVEGEYFRGFGVGVFFGWLGQGLF